MTVRDDLPPIFSALVLRPGASDEEIALGIKRPTLLVTTDQCFFRVARQGRPVHSLIAPFAVPSNEILFVMVLRIDGNELRLVLDASNPEIRDCLLKDATGCRIELLVKSTSNELAALSVDLNPGFYGDAMHRPVLMPTAERVQMATDLLLQSCLELQPRFAALPLPASLRGALVVCENNFAFQAPRS